MSDAFLWAKNDAPVADIEEWAILMAYAERADDDGCNAYQSHPTIARRAKTSTKTVQRRVKAMVDRGLLKQGDQRAVAHIEPGRRPTVYDMQIPYDWFPNINRINEYRARMKRAPLTRESRPASAPAPAMRRRKDAGTIRGRGATPLTSSTSAATDPLTGSERTPSRSKPGLPVHPPNSVEVGNAGRLAVQAGPVVPPGATGSPPTFGVTPIFQREVHTSPPPVGTTSEISTDSNNFNPQLTPWEARLHDEVLRLRPDWGSRAVRQAIAWPDVRERSVRTPELVRRAFLIGARDRARPREGYRGTWSPARFTKNGCPHWAAAAAELEAETAPLVIPTPELPPARSLSFLRDERHGRPATPSAEYLAARALIGQRATRVRREDG